MVRPFHNNYGSSIMIIWLSHTKTKWWLHFFQMESAYWSSNMRPFAKIKLQYNSYYTAMPRATTRIRSPPNREPASLAAIPAASENKAIDTVEILTPDANIDPALQTYDIDHPPPTYEIEPLIPPSQCLNSLDPDY